jgi:hypothetical protein
MDIFSIDGECRSSEHFETSMFILASTVYQLIEERTQSGMVVCEIKKRVRNELWLDFFWS